jgi:hypothetical protein
MAALVATIVASLPKDDVALLSRSKYWIQEEFDNLTCYEGFVHVALGPTSCCRKFRV